MTMPKIEFKTFQWSFTFGQIITIITVIAWFVTQYRILAEDHLYITEKVKPHIENADSATRGEIEKVVKKEIDLQVKTDIALIKQALENQGKKIDEIKAYLKEKK